jgi:predicted Mrr-cat superfamily restriction endonuclease
MVTKRFNLRVWDAHDLIERIIKNYEALPAAIKSRLPLRQLWVLDVSDPSLDRLSL